MGDVLYRKQYRQSAVWSSPLDFQTLPDGRVGGISGKGLLKPLFCPSKHLNMLLLRSRRDLMLLQWL